MKKILSTVLVGLCFATSTSTMASAKNNTYQEFLKMQEENVSINEINDFYQKNREELVMYTKDPEQAKKDANIIDVDPEPIIGEISEVDEYGSGGNNDDSMTSKEWNTIKEVATKGNILITKDDNTPIITHGHAAIVYSDCSKTIEILGFDYTPQEYNIDRWSDYKTAKLLYPASADFEKRKAAADKAKTTFVDGEWSYELLPNVTSSDSVNCATLVWKSYNSVGVKLGRFGNSSTPESLLTGSGNIKCKVSANWSCDTKW